MAKDVRSQIAKLEEQLQTLKAQQLTELRRKRRTAQKIVDDLDARIAAIAGRAAVPTKRRKRTSPAKMRSLILGAVSKDRGLTQMEIARDTKLPYGSVVAFLKNNQKEFKITGERKQKRYFVR
jgi:hypothetical protein